MFLFCYLHNLLTTEKLSLLSGYLSPFFKIRLVPHNALNGLLLHEFIDFFQPISDVVKGRAICDVVDDDDAVCSPIVATGDGLEPILSSGVPLSESMYTIWSFILSPRMFMNLIF